MATTLPLNTKKPVKAFKARIEYQMNDGSFIEVVPDPTKQSIITGALNEIAKLNTGTFPSGLEVLSVKIDVGNGLDNIK